MEAWREELLYHHGSKGMHWGVWRFRNPDGTLTEAGRRRYGIGPPRGEGSSSFKKPSSGIRRLDASNTTNRALANKNRIENEFGKPTGNETSSFLNDIKSKGKGLSLDEMMADSGMGNMSANELIKRNGEDSKKAEDAIEELGLALYDPNKGLVVRRDTVLKDPNGYDPDDDLVEVVDSPKKTSSKGEFYDVEYEPVDVHRESSDNNFRKGEDLDSSNKNKAKEAPKSNEQKESPKNNEKKESPKKDEKKEAPKKETSKKEKRSDSDDDSSATPGKTPEQLRKERLERRADLAMKKQAYGTIADEGVKITSNLATNYGKRQKMHRMNSIDYSNMTNDDLRARTERLNLERNYREAVGANVSNHERRVTSFLETTGTALAVAGSAIGIVVAIKQLKNG